MRQSSVSQNAIFSWAPSPLLYPTVAGKSTEWAAWMLWDYEETSSPLPLWVVWCCILIHSTLTVKSIDKTCKFNLFGPCSKLPVMFHQLYVLCFQPGSCFCTDPAQVETHVCWRVSGTRFTYRLWNGPPSQGAKSVQSPVWTAWCVQIENSKCC